MNMTVMIEKLKMSRNLLFLCAHGCDEIQGYFLQSSFAKDEFALLKAISARI